MANVSAFDIFLRFIRILVARKRTIAAIVLIPTAISIVAVLLAESKYKSIALIKPPVNQGFSPLDLIKESGGGALSSLLGGSETGADDCMDIFSSARFARIVIDRFDLETEYKFVKDGKAERKYYFADVVKRFQQDAKFELTNDEEAIKISMVDASPVRAKEMVSFMVYALDSLYTDIQKTLTQRKLEYIDERLALAEGEMKIVEDSLVNFQTRHNILAPDAQVRLTLENATKTELKIQQIKEDMALETQLRGTSSAHFRDLTIEKNLLQRSLAGQLHDSENTDNLILPAKVLPTLAAEYFRRERAYAIKLGVYKYLVQEAEALKLESNKNVQAISIVDPPWVNDKRVTPQRRIVVEAVFILSFLFGIFFVSLQAWWARYLNESTEARNLVSQIKKSFFKF